MEGRQANWVWAASSGAYLGLVTAVLPKRVVFIGDDFAYAESVMKTLRAGPLAQCDWLEPFNLVLPLLGASLQLVTGSFWFATLGLCLALAALNFFLLRLWIQPRDITGEIGILALALLPVWLDKTVEFTGVPLGLALFLGALLAWRSGARLVFFTLVILGIANRQSAVCLLVLPALELATIWWQQRRLDKGLLAGCLVASSVTLALLVFLPTTMGRLVEASQWPTRFTPGSFAANILIGGLLLNGGRVVWASWRGEPIWKAVQQNLSRPLVPVLVTLAGVALLASNAGSFRLERGSSELYILVAATVLGAWFNDWQQWPPLPALAYTAFYICLVSVRGVWWDYYILEPLLILAWPTARPDTLKIEWWRRLAIGTALAVGLANAYTLTGDLRIAEERTVAIETALRSGQLQIDKAWDAPFGLLGWKLLSALSIRKSEVTDLAEFLNYVDLDASGSRRSRYYDKPTRPLPPAWRDRRMPLDDSEWRELLRSN